MSQIVFYDHLALLNFANSVTVGRGRSTPGLYPLLEPLMDGADDPPFHSLLLSSSDDHYIDHSLLIYSRSPLDSWYEFRPVTSPPTNEESFAIAGPPSYFRDDTLVANMSRWHLELPEITGSDEESLVAESRVPRAMKHSVKRPPPISILGHPSSRNGPMTPMTLSSGACWMSPLPSPLPMNSPVMG